MFNTKQKRLMNELRSKVNSYEKGAFDNADAPLVRPVNRLRVGDAPGNPQFQAQFDVQVLVKYFTESAGAYTEIAASALAASLKTKLAAFVFGHTDASAGYPKLRAQYPVSVWAYNDMFVYGLDLPRCSFGDLDSTATAVLQQGDIVLPFTATTAGPVDTLGMVIIRCTQVSYSTLLNALSSDRFVTNLLRYTIDSALITQYANQIGIYSQSLFGKFNSDSISPQSFKQPDQQQSGIIDMPIEKGIDKNTSWATYVDYTAVNFTWSIFVSSVNKLQ